MHLRAQCGQWLVGQRLACFTADDGRADAPIDSEGCAQRWPEHLRFADQRHHLGRRPQVVGAGLHRDQHALGRQQRGACQCGDARRAVDDDVVGAAGQLRRFLSVSERGRIMLVPIADILFMRAELKYVTLHTRDREYLAEESLTALEQEFGDAFVRIHRSVLVGRTALRGCERTTDEDGEGAGWAVLVDGCDERLPVSRRQWPTVRALLKG